MDQKYLDAVYFLLDTIKLNSQEVEEIYSLMDQEEIHSFVQELNTNRKKIFQDTDELSIINWLKTLEQQSPKSYETLQKIICTNKALFNKIQDIFTAKILKI